MISSFHFITILMISILLDLILGDPNNKFHPVSLLGKYITYFFPKIKNEKNKKYEKKYNDVDNGNNRIFLLRAKQ